jgi:hypothetical protein
MKIVTAFIFFIGFGISGSTAQNYQTHTLYIYSFGKFVLWPEEDKKGDFEIFILGDSPIIEELQQMSERKKVGDRVIKVAKISSLGEFKKGHVLFIPSSQSAQLADVLTKLGDKSTLVVTEQPGLGVKGSDINFVMKEGKLAFELNQNALSKHKLKAANELTRLAIII